MADSHIPPNDTCPGCGADLELDQWAEIASRADDAVTEAAQTLLEALQKQGVTGNDFGDPLLSGMLTAVVNVAFAITSVEGRDEIMDFLREYLDIARTNVEATDVEGSALQ